MILTIAEIRDLAQFAGLVLTDECKADTSEDESEIAVEDCPEGGLIDTDAARVCRYAHVAYFAEYPDEGSHGLGPELPNSRISDKARLQRETAQGLLCMPNGKDERLT